MDWRNDVVDQRYLYRVTKLLVESNLQYRYLYVVSCM